MRRRMKFVAQKKKEITNRVTMMIKIADIVWNQYELNAFRTNSCTFANRV